ncbi:hypothetical protein [Streptomyces sp. NPDC059802]|uniref:hypothetical protein n=1 Tax=Streptomyces sp. NPDC059802 TaxID=3346952 RepID=UPI0036479D58
MAGVGAVTSAATLSAPALAPVAGAATDRFGPRNIAVLSNVVTAVGYLAHPLVGGYVSLFAVFAVMAGDRMYFAAWPDTLDRPVVRVASLDRITVVGAGPEPVDLLIETGSGPLAAGGS